MDSHSRAYFSGAGIYQAAVGVLNIHDIMFAHNVPKMSTKMTCAQSNYTGGSTGGGVCGL